MKRSRVVLFLFSVIALLGLLCAVFPAEGVLGLRFPQLAEVLSTPEPDPGPSPEELIELRRRAAEQDRFEDFVREDPARFYLPDDDVRFFDPLFTALEGAEQTPLRIIHYGDSQIEEDRITGTIREWLQAHFGGSGPGMMPARQVATPRVVGSSSVELQRFLIYGDASLRAGIRQYGPYGDFVRLDTTATLNYSSLRSRDRETSTFDRMTLVAGRLRSPLVVSAGGRTETVQPDGDALSFVRFELADSSTRASLTVSGAADLYGVLLDGKSGVRMDNVPMRGSSGSVFTSMDSAQLRSFYREENVRLILLQYGGNSVPYLNTDASVTDFLETVRRQILHVQELAPDAKIIFIGPSDMSTVVSGKRQTYPRLPALVDSLKVSAVACGAAYWDIYGVMGGENSMVQWVSAQPALAGSDYVHFTLAGSTRVGDMFCDALRVYYDDYRRRRG